MRSDPGGSRRSTRDGRWSTYDPEVNLEELNLDRRVAVRSGFGTGGRLETLEVAIGGAVVDILTDVTYHPDGTWAELSYCNGVTLRAGQVPLLGGGSTSRAAFRAVA